MSIRKVSFVPGEYYHIYNRGNSKQRIFHDTEDQYHFTGLLFACNQKENFKIDNLQKGKSLYEIEKKSNLVSIGAHVLMPNHFHLLLTESHDGHISKFMQKLSTAYVMYYNKKYKRTGGLFVGKFKSKHISTDGQLKYLFSYIHLNPIKLIDKNWKENGIKDKKKTLNYLKKYIHSSFLDYFGVQRVQNKIIHLEPFPKYFPNKKSFMREIVEWLSYREPLR